MVSGASDEPALFEATPVPRLHVGEWVTVQTMWGDEPAKVLAVFYDDGHPTVKLLTTSGDTISVSVARVTRTNA